VLPSPIRWVTAAAALMTEVGEDTGMFSVWCSPIPKKSSPTASASWMASIRSRIAWPVRPVVPSLSRGVLPKLYTPSWKAMPPPYP